MKKVLSILLLIFAILFVLGLIKDFLIRSAVVAGAKQTLGADVSIGSFSLGILSQSVKMRSFKVYNPDGFPTKEVLVDIPEVAVQLDVPALFKNTLHVRYLRLNLKEARLIKNKDGQLNVNALKLPPQSEKQMSMKFDLVSLSVGRVVMEDYFRTGTEPKITKYDVDIKDRELLNINSAQELSAEVMMAALTPAGLASAFTLGDQVLGDIKGTAHSLGQAFKNFFKGSKR
ncbi:MAG: hypothetical protein HQL18_00725 [Candidatus Omnitrophica bacterium]|nr:hypothetical protein [Candidatus Omnitrophota bacterium]